MSVSPLTPSEAKRLLVQYLLRDAQAHDNCEFDLIGQGHDDFPRVSDTSDEEGYLQFLRAENFWDFWQDTRNHSYWDKWSAFHENASAYYSGVRQDDWPVFARRICRSLQENRKMDEDIVEAVFHAPSRPPFWERWLKKKPRKIE